MCIKGTRWPILDRYCRPSVSRVSVNMSVEYRSSVDRDVDWDVSRCSSWQSVKCRRCLGRCVGRHIDCYIYRYIDQRSTVSRPLLGRPIDQYFVSLSDDTRLAVCRWYIGRLSVVYRSTGGSTLFLLPFFIFMSATLVTKIQVVFTYCLLRSM